MSQAQCQPWGRPKVRKNVVSISVSLWPGVEGGAEGVIATGPLSTAHVAVSCVERTRATASSGADDSESPRLSLLSEPRKAGRDCVVTYVGPPPPIPRTTERAIVEFMTTKPEPRNATSVRNIKQHNDQQPHGRAGLGPGVGCPILAACDSGHSGCF